MTKARKAGLVTLATAGLLLGGAGAASAAAAQPQSLLNSVSNAGLDATGSLDPSVVSQLPALGGVAG